MGCFSWIYSDTNKPLRHTEKAYLLVPPQFQDMQGKHIYEAHYDGYGNFGGYAAFELVALWNQEFVSVDMLDSKPTFDKYSLGLYDFEKENLAKQGMSQKEIEAKGLALRKEYFAKGLQRYEREVKRLEDFKNHVPEKEMVASYGEDYLMEIGIDIACDEKNAKLPFPIKITSKPMDYDDVKPSNRDPGQGCW